MPVLKLLPACKEYIWGGKNLIEKYGKKFEGEKLAETWELSCHPDGLSIIANGEYRDVSLKDYISKEGSRVLGDRLNPEDDFPILIKFIDAADNLSIQVHPDDEYAMLHEKQHGKTEMWYVLEADEGSFIYIGFKKEISKTEMIKRIDDGTFLDVLQEVQVHKGDVFFIPSGTVHAICKGIRIAEIQQNSSITYRVFDYGRLDKDGKPRQLHIKQAIDVAKLEIYKGSRIRGNILASNKYFNVEHILGNYEGTVGKESFVSLLVIEGEGVLNCGEDIMDIKKGDSIFISAGSGPFSILGNVEALKTTI